jgi:hypothetical protein
MSSNELFGTDRINLGALYTGIGVTVVVAAPVAVEILPAIDEQLLNSASKATCLLRNMSRVWVAEGATGGLIEKYRVLTEHQENQVFAAGFSTGNALAIYGCLVR